MSSIKRFQVVLVGGKSEKSVTLSILAKGLQVASLDKTINQLFPLKSIVRYSKVEAKLPAGQDGPGHVDIVVETSKHGVKSIRFRTKTQSGANTLVVAIEETLKAANWTPRSASSLKRQASQGPPQPGQAPAAPPAPPPPPAPSPSSSSQPQVQPQQTTNTGGLPSHPPSSRAPSPSPGPTPAQYQQQQQQQQQQHVRPPQPTSMAYSAPQTTPSSAPSFKATAQKVGIFSSVFGGSAKQAQAQAQAQAEAQERMNERYSFALQLLSETNNSRLDVDVVLHAVNGIILRRVSGETMFTFPKSCLRRVAVLAALSPPRLKLSLIMPRHRSEQDLIMLTRTGAGNTTNPQVDLQMLTQIAEAITAMYLSGSAQVADFLDASVESAGQMYMLSPEKYEREQQSQQQLRHEAMELCKQSERRAAAAEDQRAASEQKLAAKIDELAAAVAARAAADQEVAVGKATIANMQERLEFAEGRVVELMTSTINHEVKVQELEATIVRQQQEMDAKEETILDLTKKLAAAQTAAATHANNGATGSVSSMKKKKKKKVTYAANAGGRQLENGLSPSATLQQGQQERMFILAQQQQQQHNYTQQQQQLYTPHTHMGVTPGTAAFSQPSPHLGGVGGGSWTQMKSTTTGRTFYYNTHTGESRWKLY